MNNQIDPTEKFNINLNQNLWLLLITLIALGVREYFCLNSLYIFAFILTIMSIISIIFTLTAYTIRYCMDKLKK